MKVESVSAKCSVPLDAPVHSVCASASGLARYVKHVPFWNIHPRTPFWLRLWRRARVARVPVVCRVCVLSTESLAAWFIRPFSFCPHESSSPVGCRIRATFSTSYYPPGYKVNGLRFSFVTSVLEFLIFFPLAPTRLHPTIANRDLTYNGHTDCRRPSVSSIPTVS